MIRSEAELDIAAPIDRVCDFVANPANAPRWMEACQDLRLTSPDGWRTGATLHYVYSQDGHQGEMEGVVSEYEPNRTITLSFKDSKFSVTASLNFDLSPTGTRVTHTVTIDPKWFMARLLKPLIKSGADKQVIANLARLKALIETG